MLKWTVSYDGPSRPIILGPNFIMLSLSKFVDGRWQPYEEEDRDCQIFCDAMNKRTTDVLA